MATRSGTTKRWWLPPRRLADRDHHRSVSFLELFYDLVYVVLIAEVSHSLATGMIGIAGYVFLFAVVWFAWINGSLYHELHGNDDIRTRIFTFGQMFCVAAMALFTHDALGETANGFALSYAAFQFIITFMWWRTGVHDPEHRLLSIPYVITFLIVTLMFAGSVFVATPMKFYVWAIGIAMTLLTPLGSVFVAHRHPEVRPEMDRTSTATHSLIERQDLFVIIVLGEVITGVVRGLAAHHDLTPGILLTGGLGMLVAIGLWWLYFDSAAGKKPLEGRNGILIWLYLHLPLTMGITAVGAAVLNAIASGEGILPPEKRWLLTGSIAVAVLTTGLLCLVVDLGDKLKTILRPAIYTMFALGVAVLCLGAFELRATTLLALSAIGLLLPVILGVRTWLRFHTEQARKAASVLDEQ